MELAAADVEFAGGDVFEFADTFRGTVEQVGNLAVRETDQDENTDTDILFVERLLLQTGGESMEKIVCLSAESSIIVPCKFGTQIVCFAEIEDGLLQLLFAGLPVGRLLQTQQPALVVNKPSGKTEDDTDESNDKCQEKHHGRFAVGAVAIK